MTGNTNPPPTRWYLPHEVAPWLRCDVKTLARWVAEGHFPHIRTPGGHLRLDADYVDAVLRGEVRFDRRGRKEQPADEPAQ